MSNSLKFVPKDTGFLKIQLKILEEQIDFKEQQNKTKQKSNKAIGRVNSVDDNKKSP